MKWFTYSESEQKPKELDTVEVSVYDLRKHQKFAFRPGSIVKSKPTVEYKMGHVIDSYPQVINLYKNFFCFKKYIIGKFSQEIVYLLQCVCFCKMIGEHFYLPIFLDFTCQSIFIPTFTND